MLYKDMVVWKVAREIVKEVYAHADRFPSNERYGLGNQLRRASVSIASNIAEGKYRNTRKEYARFVSMALASAVEVECQLHLAIATNIIRTDITPLLRKVGKEISMLINLRKKLTLNNPL